MTVSTVLIVLLMMGAESTRNMLSEIAVKNKSRALHQTVCIKTTVQLHQEINAIKKDNYTPHAKKGSAATNGHTLEDFYKNGITEPQRHSQLRNT
jgi:hypothetical protein